MLHPIPLTLFTVLLLAIFLFLLHMRQKRKELKIIDKDPDTSPKYHPEQLRKIANQLDRIFADHKIYTNSDLTICDLANELGTNRTYVSSSINVCYNQNFNSYVNQFRLDEMKDIILNRSDVSNKELVSMCGFGSIDTMKRVVKQKTGLSLNDWKEQILREDKL
ncbi:MAG TPA: helix-turn-helix domain-containing protein [Paludibacter sp.]|jgi:YesN/AraC family two-component response regulator|nr:helix-turn-helix domain-containing protein [Paludibacter sp.]